MSYEEMSDLEINLQVAIVLFEHYEQIRQSVNGGSEIYVDNGYSAFYDFDSGTFDYCKDPSDAWPIIVANDITVRGGGISFIERSFMDVPAHIVRHPNPLRAAMICFLKMKDAEHD